MKCRFFIVSACVSVAILSLLASSANSQLSAAASTATQPASVTALEQTSVELARALDALVQELEKPGWDYSRINPLLSSYTRLTKRQFELKNAYHRRLQAGLQRHRKEFDKALATQPAESTLTPEEEERFQKWLKEGNATKR